MQLNEIVFDGMNLAYNRMQVGEILRAAGIGHGQTQKILSGLNKPEFRHRRGQYHWEDLEQVMIGLRMNNHDFIAANAKWITMYESGSTNTTGDEEMNITESMKRTYIEMRRRDLAESEGTGTNGNGAVESVDEAIHPKNSAIYDLHRGNWYNTTKLPKGVDMGDFDSVPEGLSSGRWAGYKVQVKAINPFRGYPYMYHSDIYRPLYRDFMAAKGEGEVFLKAAWTGPGKKINVKAGERAVMAYRKRNARHLVPPESPIYKIVPSVERVTGGYTPKITVGGLETINGDMIWNNSKVAYKEAEMFVRFIEKSYARKRMIVEVGRYREKNVRHLVTHHTTDDTYDLFTSFEALQSRIMESTNRVDESVEGLDEASYAMFDFSRAKPIVKKMRTKSGEGYLPMIGGAVLGHRGRTPMIIRGGLGPNRQLPEPENIDFFTGGHLSNAYYGSSASAKMEVSSFLGAYKDGGMRRAIRAVQDFRTKAESDIVHINPKEFRSTKAAMKDLGIYNESIDTTGDEEMNTTESMKRTYIEMRRDAWEQTMNESTDTTECEDVNTTESMEKTYIEMRRRALAESRGLDEMGDGMAGDIRADSLELLDGHISVIRNKPGEIVHRGSAIYKNADLARGESEEYINAVYVTKKNPLDAIRMYRKTHEMCIVGMDDMGESVEDIDEMFSNPEVLTFDSDRDFQNFKKDQKKFLQSMRGKNYRSGGKMIDQDIVDAFVDAVGRLRNLMPTAKILPRLAAKKTRYTRLVDWVGVSRDVKSSIGRSDREIGYDIDNLNRYYSINFEQIHKRVGEGLDETRGVGEREIEVKAVRGRYAYPEFVKRYPTSAEALAAVRKLSPRILAKVDEIQFMNVTKGKHSDYYSWLAGILWPKQVPGQNKWKLYTRRKDASGKEWEYIEISANYKLR